MKDIELLQYVHETASMGVLGLRCTSSRKWKAPR